MVQVSESVCDECGTCISVCGENALTLTDSLLVDQDTCISCGICVTVCPFGALSLSESKKPEIAE